MHRLGIDTGKPLADMASYVDGIRAAQRQAGELPPIYLATLRNKMLDLAVAHADGVLWANASRRFITTQIQRIPEERRSAFFLANMLPTVIDTDLDAARAVHRRTLQTYVTLPNYRNYWKLAGYEAEMADIERALEDGDRERVTAAMTDEWVDDCTLSGSPAAVRNGIQAWFDVGVVPIAVMSSTSGGQAKAIGQLFEAYD